MGWDAPIKTQGTLPDLSQPIVVQLTPPGRGAIATLLVHGPGALEAVESVFQAAGGQTLRASQPERLLFGHVGGPNAEEVIVQRRSDRSVEIHCHGGHAAVRMVQGLLAQRGCRPMPWQTWAASQCHDPIQAAALLALPEARTLRTAAILLDQYHGALRRSVERIRGLLAAEELANAYAELKRLLARASLGRHLTRPWQVALAGPPNVGKSTLLNALLGFQRAIVDPRPGTTRDVISATTAVGGWPVEFLDTAGQRPTECPLERAGIALAEQRLASADLVILVLDATGGDWQGRDQLLAKWPEAMRVYNKCDLLESPDRMVWQGVPVSAIRGDGIRTLLEAVVKRLVPYPPDPGEGVPFEDSQVQWLQRVAAAISAGDLKAALALLAG